MQVQVSCLPIFVEMESNKNRKMLLNLKTELTKERFNVESTMMETNFLGNPASSEGEQRLPTIYIYHIYI